MGKSMRNRTINREFRAYPNSYNHKSDLINLTVAKHATEIIFNHRVENREHSHNTPNSNQDISTWKKANQHTNSTLRGKCTKPNRARWGGFRITILQPSM